MKFGEKVRDLRKKHSLTQDELAQCLGINKRTIIGWERDGRYPRRPICNRISLYLSNVLPKPTEKRAK